MAESPRIEELKRRVQSDPASIAFAALAEEYRRAGRYQEAIDTCTAGLVRHPSYLSAHVTLGRALIDVGRLAEGKKELESVLRLAPENLAAIRGLAEIHERLRHEAHEHRAASEGVADESADSQITAAEIQAVSGFAPPVPAEPTTPAADIRSSGQSAVAEDVRQPEFPENTPSVFAPPPIAEEEPATVEAPAKLAPEEPSVHAAASVAPEEPAPAERPASVAPEEPAPAERPASVAPEEPAAAERPASFAREEPVIFEMPAMFAPPDHVQHPAIEDPALAGLEEFLNAILRARSERAAAR